MGKAMGDYEMLCHGDKVMVAVSGGKDSLSLLKILQYRQSFIPIEIEILAVYVHNGISGPNVDQLASLFQSWKVDYRIHQIDLAPAENAKDIDCFWCSWTRRKALFDLAQQLGFNKIAFGHHLDDIIETILMNLFYRAEISAMRPKQELFNGKLTIIRPLSYETESIIQQFADHEGFVHLDRSLCPHQTTSKRAVVKKFIAELEKDNPSIKMNIFNSLNHIKHDYLLDVFIEKPNDIL